MPRLISAAITAAVFSLSASAFAQAPQGYPADYGKIVDAAKKEGKVVIYSTTDAAAANPLIRDFEALYPGITVEYSDLNSTELYNRFIAEAASGSGTADVAWSSAMDLQVKLVADGQAATYASPEIPALPKWAVWNNQAYGTTYEPITFVYNKRLVPAGDVPQDHTALLNLLTTKTAAYKGKITAYDPERSGVGYLFVNEDVKDYPKAWDLFRAFGKAGIRALHQRRRDDGACHLGRTPDRLRHFRLLCACPLEEGSEPRRSYCRRTIRSSPRAWSSSPSRRRTRTPRKLFLDYLLSKRGQNDHRQQGRALFVARRRRGRGDSQGVTELVGDKARPVPIGPELLTNLDRDKRLAFLKKWQAAMKGQ